MCKQPTVHHETLPKLEHAIVLDPLGTTDVPSASTEIPSGNGMEIDNSDLTFGIHPFYIKKGKLFSCPVAFIEQGILRNTLKDRGF
ncbi:hypothetical protein Tco_1574057 [Tanacetum coccineum]